MTLCLDLHFFYFYPNQTKTKGHEISFCNEITSNENRLLFFLADEFYIYIYIYR